MTKEAKFFVIAAAMAGLLTGCATAPKKCTKGNCPQCSDKGDKSNCGSKSGCSSKNSCRAKGNCSTKGS